MTEPVVNPIAEDCDHLRDWCGVCGEGIYRASVGAPWWHTNRSPGCPCRFDGYSCYRGGIGMTTTKCPGHGRHWFAGSDKCTRCSAPNPESERWLRQKAKRDAAREAAYATYSAVLEEMCDECVDADHSHSIRRCIHNGCGCERANWPTESASKPSEAR